MSGRAGCGGRGGRDGEGVGYGRDGRGVGCGAGDALLVFACDDITCSTY